MAYSEDTQAIIDRLKAEGDLIRNSGTNSVKSLNIKLEKFDGLFKSINTNIIEQTSMLQKQMGITVDAAERLRAQEQFEEVTPAPTANQTDDYDKGKGSSKADTDKAIDRMGSDIAKAFSFKNLLLAGAAGFVGFNFIKGFVDEFGGIKPLLQELGVPESTFTSMESLGTTFTEMKTSLEGLTGPEGSITAMSKSLTDIGTTLASLNTKFETILNMNWTTIASVAFGALSTFGVVCAGLRYRLQRMTLELQRGTAMRNGRTWWQHALGLNKDGGTYVPPETNVKTPIYNPDGTVKGPGQSARPGSMIPEVTTTKPPVVAPEGGGRGSYGIDTPEGRANVRADAANMRSGGFKFDANGRLQNTGGGFASDKAALEALEASLDPRYSKVFRTVVKAAVIVGVAFAIYDTYQIYHILNNTSGMFDTDEKKINAIGPIIGPQFTGIAAGALGAALGFSVGGPWGSLIGGLVFGVGAAFLTPAAFGIMLAKGLFGLAPSDDDRAALLPGQVTPRPTTGGHNGRNAKMRWDEAYSNTHSPLTGMPLGNLETSSTFTPYTSSGPTSRGSVGRKDRRDAQKAGATAKTAAETMPTAIFDADGRLIIYDEFGNPRSLNNIEMRGPLGDLLRSDAGGGGGGVAMASVAPVVAPTYIMQGGSEVKQITFKSGNSMNGGSLLPYGMTSNYA